jgi:large subunit ribosomal protein L9
MGFDVAKAQVRMPNGPLKTRGRVHTVSVALHTDVAVDVTVHVVGAAD